MTRFETMPSDDILAELAAVRDHVFDVPEAYVAAVGELVKRGVYPSQAGKPVTPLGMVKGWGAFWHEWRAPLRCPHCHADLRDHVAGPPFKRELGHYDRAEKFTCPDCRQDLAARILRRCHCDALLTPRQRLYCSRRCNHKGCVDETKATQS